MALCLFPASCGLVVEVDGKGADGLAQNPDACPDCRDGKGAFRGDDGFLCGIGHSVGEKHLIHSGFELAGTYALLSFQERGKR